MEHSDEIGQLLKNIHNGVKQSDKFRGRSESLCKISIDVTMAFQTPTYRTPSREKRRIIGLSRAVGALSRTWL